MFSGEQTKMSAKIFIAKEDQSESPIHIHDVSKNDNKQFVCFECGATLIPVKSEARKKDWHFRHFLQANCSGARDSALHSYAIQILLESSLIVLPKIGNLVYHNPRKEVTILNLRSDVAIKDDKGDIQIEIFVTHDLDEAKIATYRSNRVRCLKIDLSDKRLLRTDPDKIRAAVIEQINNKTIIYWDNSEQEQVAKENNWSMSFTDIIVVAGIILVAKYVFTKVMSFFRR
jgi:hypothetical protein